MSNRHKYYLQSSSDSQQESNQTSSFHPQITHSKKHNPNSIHSSKANANRTPSNEFKQSKRQPIKYQSMMPPQSNIQPNHNQSISQIIIDPSYLQITQYIPYVYKRKLIDHHQEVLVKGRKNINILKDFIQEDQHLKTIKQQSNEEQRKQRQIKMIINQNLKTKKIDNSQNSKIDDLSQINKNSLSQQINKKQNSDYLQIYQNRKSILNYLQFTSNDKSKLSFNEPSYDYKPFLIQEQYVKQSKISSQQSRSTMKGSKKAKNLKNIIAMNDNL